MLTHLSLAPHMSPNFLHQQGGGGGGGGQQNTDYY